MGAGVTLSEAIEKQLGLKLTEERRALPIFVMDPAEKPKLG